MIHLTIMDNNNNDVQFIKDGIEASANNRMVIRKCDNQKE